MLLTVALSALGVTTGALAARVAELQVVLIPLSVVSLGAAHYLASRTTAPRRQRAILWAATALSVGFWVAPPLLR